MDNQATQVPHCPACRQQAWWRTRIIEQVAFCEADAPYWEESHLREAPEDVTPRFQCACGLAVDPSSLLHDQLTEIE